LSDHLPEKRHAFEHPTRPGKWWKEERRNSLENLQNTVNAIADIIKYYNSNNLENAALAKRNAMDQFDKFLASLDSKEQASSSHPSALRISPKERAIPILIPVDVPIVAEPRAAVECPAQAAVSVELAFAAVITMIGSCFPL
jgi:hypothetical protein